MIMECKDLVTECKAAIYEQNELAEHNSNTELACYPPESKGLESVMEEDDKFYFPRAQFDSPLAKCAYLGGLAATGIIGLGAMVMAIDFAAWCAAGDISFIMRSIAETGSFSRSQFHGDSPALLLAPLSILGGMAFHSIVNVLPYSIESLYVSYLIATTPEPDLLTEDAGKS